MFVLKTKIADVFRGGQTLRPASQVHLELKQRRLTPTFLTTGRLMRLSAEQYNPLMKVLDQISRMPLGTIKIAVPKLKTLERMNFEALPISRLTARCLTGNTLRLKHVISETMELGKERAILEEQLRGQALSELSKIERAIQDEIEKIKSLVNSPGLSVQGAINIVDESRKAMGFKNVSIYELRENGNLALRFRSEYWESFWDKAKSNSKYEEPGRKPLTTMASILEDTSGRIIYDVNINDLSTFESENLTPDHESIKDDLENSTGPGRYLFIRIREDGFQWVMHIHSRVKKTESLVPLGLFDVEEIYENDPEVQGKITGIKNLLEQWAIAIGLAMAAARNVQRALHLEEREKPYSDKQFLRTSEIFTFGELSIEQIEDTKDLIPMGAYIVPALQEMTIELYKEYGIEEAILRKILFTSEIIREHTLDAEDLLIVRSGTKIVGFASGKFLDIGEGDRIYYLAGTMLRKEIQARGLLLLLNFRLLLKGLVEHWTIYHNVPKPLLVAARTQESAVLYALYNYFQDPTPALEREDDAKIKRLREAVAKKLGGQVDNLGIIKNAYPGKISIRSPIEVPPTAPGLRAAVARLCSHLGDRDAVLFMGKFSLEIPKARELFLEYGGAYKEIIKTLEKGFPHK